MSISIENEGDLDEFAHVMIVGWSLSIPEIIGLLGFS